MRHWKALVVVSAALTVGISAIGQQSTIKIGAITTLTGRLAEFGKQQKAGFELAVREINGRGGINKQKIELILE